MFFHKLQNYFLIVLSDIANLPVNLDSQQNPDQQKENSMNITGQTNGREEAQNLSAENERLRKRLKEEFGMISEFGELSPDLENLWLKHICSFEEQHAEGKRTTVFEYIGKPEYMPPDSLSGEEISRELTRILELMSRSNVEFSALCEQDEKKLYAFVVNELFKTEMDDIRVEGMKTCFIYEEFYPNHDYDLKNTAETMLNSCLCRKFSLTNRVHWLDKELKFRGKVLSREEFVMQMNILKEMLDADEITDINLQKSEHDTEKAKAKVSGVMEYRSGAEIRYLGYELGFVYINKAWIFSSMSLEGFDDL